MTRSELISAIETRHSVRNYLEDKKIEDVKIRQIKDAVDKANNECGDLAFRVVLDEPKAFGGRWASYGNFHGVNNYLVIAAKQGKRLDVMCGIKGEEIVLLMQHLGLNTCWVGLTYKKIEGAFSLQEDDAIRCVIAFGYGKDTAGRSHKRKSPEQVSNVSAESPEWFQEGVRLALLAPTAVNQQKFFFEYNNDTSVTATARFSLVGYSRIDLGIAITHLKVANPDVEIKLNI